MSTFLELPQEILEEILDFGINTHGWGKRELATCALLHPSFTFQSQRRLFQKITLTGDPSLDEPPRWMKRVEELYDIVARKPHIAGLISEMTIALSFVDSTWITEAKFTQLMSLMKRSGFALRKFSMVRGSGIFPVILDSKSVFESFLAPFIAPSITTLRLSNIQRIPLAFIASCSQLTSLHLALAFFDSFLPDYILAFDIRPRITELELVEPSGTALAPFLQSQTAEGLDIVDFSSLKSFSVSLTNGPTELLVVSAVMRIAERSLQSLSLSIFWDNWVGEFTGRFIETVKFETMESLRDLDVRSAGFTDYIKGEFDVSRNFVRRLGKLLSTIPSANKVQKVTIQGNGDCEQIQEMMREEMIASDWRSLDNALVNISAGKPFAFNLIVDILDESDSLRQWMNDFREGLLQKLPRSASDAFIDLGIHFPLST